MGPVSFETIEIEGDVEAVRGMAARLAAAGCRIEQLRLPTDERPGSVVVRSVDATRVAEIVRSG